MKNLRNLKGAQLLSKKEQQSINGGADFTCYCGFTGGAWEQFTFAVNANSIGDALEGAGVACGGRGATCSGNTQ